jgi:hypothetical protein
MNTRTNHSVWDTSSIALIALAVLMLAVIAAMAISQLPPVDVGSDGQVGQAYGHGSPGSTPTGTTLAPAAAATVPASGGAGLSGDVWDNLRWHESLGSGAASRA